jgi:cyclopropane fatty-acyl-phospholipid synthase-like methyltransferase
MRGSAESEAADPGRFYDALRASGPSVAALAYGDAYIGQECLLTADEISTFALRAGIGAGTWVLDVGSGTGGPACYLARKLGCRVLGVDISAVGHAQAEARAREHEVGDLAQFRLGDIHAIELPAAAFDVVIGLDSWCHIQRRPVFLQRCADLLRPGGRLAFYDHVERRPLSEESRRRFCAGWRFAGLETPGSYLDALESAGFELVFHEETSAYAVRFYTRVLEGYRAGRARFEAARGPERYQEGLERLEMSRHLAATGVLGQLGCIALKPKRCASARA